MKRLGYRRLPLFWKLLVPYVGLLVIVGTLGAFLITRDLASRARGSLNEQLLQSSLRARALLNEDELSLLESANLAANLEEMAAFTGARDAERVKELLRSVLALKKELDILAIVPRDGAALAEYRAGASGGLRPAASSAWQAEAFVRAAMDDPAGAKTAGLTSVGGRPALAIAAPICTRGDSCASVGAAVVGMYLHSMAAEAGAATGASPGAGLTIYDPRGAILATAGPVPGRPTPVRIASNELVRRIERRGGTDVQTLYAPFQVQGRTVGMTAVTLASAPAFASVRGAAVRLVVILLLGLAGIVAVGALLSRLILAQTRPLLATNRSLGEGDLTARAPVVSDDELGELARGLNKMADQLQASYETLELRVEQRTEEVQRLLRERTEFFASLSHELRTPIALLINYGEMLVDPDFRKTPKTIEERGTVIRDTGKQLLAVVNDILDLARLEVGSVRIEVVDTSLPDLFAALRPTLNGLASAGAVTLRIDVPSDLPDVRADPARLREVLVNLIDNAVKYTPRGGSVAVAASASEGWVAVHVSDTGVGIPPESQRRIFEPFFQVPGTRTQRGQLSTGLGLAIAKRLVEAQMGEIAVESEPGRGTVFTVRLPAVGTSLRSLEAARQNVNTSARRARGGKGREQARGRVS